ncbi:MAG: magnesium/cobalt transporter CorA [Bacteroidales bacterium]|nr:magnesium/cobalt transporter CorA [Bacteroidales bacterium]MDD3890706.1 magnesium/cobalt transporter CorA [Bacteroidales bacterium]
MKKVARKPIKKINGLLSINKRKVSRRKKPGDPPGTIIHTGERVLDDILITVHDFDEKHSISLPVKEVEKLSPFLKSKSKTWIQVRGLHDIDKLKSIWNYFSLHPLVQEDIVSTNQRPKIELYSDFIFIVLRSLTPRSINGDSININNEQISIVLGKNFVLSFQESNEPIFEPIIKRLELEGTRLRKLGPDYLAYALLDCIVDHYYSTLDALEGTIDIIESEIMYNPQNHHLQQIHSLRSDLVIFKKSIWSLRDGLNSLIRDDSPFVDVEVKIFIRDVYDHLIQVIDTLENIREMIYSLYDMHMSNISNRMNEIMKVLTIIATIFIPLTFIAGIYGMNFNPNSSPWNMPELNWYWGYPVSIGLMVFVTLLMLVYFKRKRWL